MEFKKQFSVLGEQIRELLKKLTFSQKVTIGLLSLLIAVSLIMVVNMGRGESFVPLGMGQDPEELQRVKMLLDQHKIPFRTIDGDGGESIEVPKSQAQGILLLAAENGMIGAKDTNMEWLFGEGSLFTTASQMDNRILESRKRSVSDAIRWNSSVRDARIVVDLGPKPIYTVDTRSNNTASVSVALRPGVEKLSRSEARAIRKLVSGAFNILTKNIQVIDDKLHIYDPLAEDNPYLSEEEDSLQIHRQEL